MAVLDAFRRGWGWVWLLGTAEIALVGSEAVPLFRPVPPQPLLAQPAARATDSPARVSLQPILDFQPFGTPAIPAPAPVTETPVVEALPSLPVTAGYALQGVLFRDDGVPSRAILAWNGGAPASFVVGDALPSGATLAGIEANRVWLEKDGDTRFLEFPASGSALQDPTGSDLPAEAPPNDAASPADDQSLPPPKTQIMPQPDLRNLIPGLVATPPSEN